MLTLLGYGLLAILVGAVLFLLAAYLLPPGEQIAPPIRDEPIWALPPERQLVPEDVAVVRLPIALRGYRFAETDLLLDRLADELRARDFEIATLRGTPVASDERGYAEQNFAEHDDAEHDDAEHGYSEHGYAEHDYAEHDYAEHDFGPREAPDALDSDEQSTRPPVEADEH